MSTFLILVIKQIPPILVKTAISVFVLFTRDWMLPNYTGVFSIQFSGSNMLTNQIRLAMSRIDSLWIWLRCWSLSLPIWCSVKLIFLGPVRSCAWCPVHFLHVCRDSSKIQELFNLHLPQLKFIDVCFSKGQHGTAKQRIPLRLDAQSSANGIVCEMKYSNSQLGVPFVWCGYHYQHNVEKQRKNYTAQKQSNQTS